MAWTAVALTIALCGELGMSIFPDIPIVDLKMYHI